jgi:Trk K+ transport system NAD-binding subunit
LRRDEEAGGGYMEIRLYRKADDEDNLMIASVGLKVYDIPHIIALCNSQNNLKLYKEFNFDKVLLNNNEMDELFNTVKGFVQNAVKNEV